MIESSAVYNTSKFGFSQAVIHDGLIFGSGQAGWNNEHTLVGQEFKMQLNQTILNIENILIEVNSNWDDVIHIRFYVVDLTEDKRMTIGSFLRGEFNKEYFPASTIIGVESLAREELELEIEFIAKMNKNENNNYNHECNHHDQWSGSR